MEEPEGRYRMPVSRWRRIAKIIVHKRGRPMKDPKATLEAIIDCYQGGYQWRKLPSEYGLKWNSVARAHRRLSERQAYLMLLLTLKKNIDYGVLLIDGSFMKVHRSAAGDRRQLVLPVASTILADRDGQSSRPPANSCAGHRLCRYTVKANSIDTPSDSHRDHYVNRIIRESLPSPAYGEQPGQHLGCVMF